MTTTGICAPLRYLTIFFAFITIIKAQGPSGPCIDTGPFCVNDCSEVPNFQDGNYQWCESCRWFVQCANRNTFYQPCPSNQVWHDYFKDCLSLSTTCQECVVLKPITSEIPPTTTMLPIDRTCSHTGDACIETCQPMFNGDYQWCGSCSYFLQCRGSENYFTACPAGLVYDHDLKRCDYVSGTCHCQANTLPPSACESAPCQNGGLCHDDGSGIYVCDCEPEFSGPNCEDRKRNPPLINP